MYYKIAKDGYILSIGSTERNTENEITESEYNEIMTIIRNCPAREGYEYRLKTDLTWEEYEVEPPEPEPDEIDSDEALSIILDGGVE